MKEKFNVDDFVSPLEILEQALKTLEVFHLDDERFEDIESYIKAVSILKGVSE